MTSILLNTDSYKTSHFLQYPPEAEFIHSYIAPRGGKYPEVLFFGLQAFIKKYLLPTITKDDVNEAKSFCSKHGVPFNDRGWMHIVEQCAGKLPLIIQAVPEGTVLPLGNVCVTVENTDVEALWLTSYIETALLRCIWYPSSVATVSKHCLEIIKKYYVETSDSPDGFLFGLHDFGGRAATSLESSALGGLAHLLNFRGTDNIPACLAASEFYGCKEMPGFSIPAAEHSTITSWGRHCEIDAYHNMLTQFAKPGSIVAIVSDSYDIDNAVSHIWGEVLREEVIRSGATIVIRPDSGDPCLVVPRLIAMLDCRFGSTINSKGYKVLKHVKLIQGDGVNHVVIRKLLGILAATGYSAENLNFGMGHELLQAVTRDTLGWAMKASSICIRGSWSDIFKDPVTDSKKASKKGRQMLFLDPEKGFFTDRLHTENHGAKRMLEPIFVNGTLVKEYSFGDIRERASKSPMLTI